MTLTTNADTSVTATAGSKTSSSGHDRGSTGTVCHSRRAPSAPRCRTARQPVQVNGALHRSSQRYVEQLSSPPRSTSATAAAKPRNVVEPGGRLAYAMLNRAVYSAPDGHRCQRRDSLDTAIVQVLTTATLSVSAHGDRTRYENGRRHSNFVGSGHAVCVEFRWGQRGGLDHHEQYGATYAYPASASGTNDGERDSNARGGSISDGEHDRCS